jgi:glutamate synthase (NADPH/NADH) large chain
LVQARGLDRVDLSPILEHAGPMRHGGRDIRVLAAPRAPEQHMRLGSEHRFVATSGAGQLARQAIAGSVVTQIDAAFAQGSVAGNGLSAYSTDGVSVIVHGGAQDGAAKTALGGSMAVLKARNSAGTFVDGSVGKCFAYGAQRGRFLVQGGADARAGIRLSGADVLFGGDLNGFAFEYMTGGRAIVLGDPGRWICSGMSGGAVYLHHDPARGLDEAGMRDRLAKGAKVNVKPPTTDEDVATLRDLVGSYATLLEDGGQVDDAASARALLDEVATNFRVIRPGADIVEQTISTE